MAKKTAKPTPVKPPKQSKGFLRGFFDVVKAIILSPVALIAAITRRFAGKEAVAEANAKYEAEEAERETTRQNIRYAKETTNTIQQIIDSKDENYRNEGYNIKEFEMYVPDVVPGADNQKLRFAVHVKCYNGTEHNLYIDGTDTLLTDDTVDIGVAKQVETLLQTVRPKSHSERTDEQSPEPVGTQDDPSQEEPPSPNEEAGKDEQNVDTEGPEQPTHEPVPDNTTCISYGVREEGELKDTALSFVYSPIDNDTGKHVGGYCACCMAKPGGELQIATQEILAIDTKTLSGIGSMLADNGHQLDAGETLQYIATCQSPPKGLILVPSANGRALLINILPDSTVSVSKLQEDQQNEFQIEPITEEPITRSQLLSNDDVRAALYTIEGFDVIDNTQQVEDATPEVTPEVDTPENGPETMDVPSGDDEPEL